MQTVLVPPNLDAGPNDYAPTPSQAHYLNVREDPDDGDATMLVTVAGMREVYGLDVSLIPIGSIITSLRIASAQKKSTAGANSYRVGLIIGGVDYFLMTYTLTSGSTYESDSVIITADPSDGEAFTRERLTAAYLVHEQISQAQGLPRPRLTQLVIFADIIPPADRPVATDAAVVGGVAASGSAASGTPQAIAPLVTAAAVVGSGNPMAIAGEATGASIAPVATAAAPTRTAPAAGYGKPSAVPTAIAPSTVAVSLDPTATPAAYTPPAGDGA